MKVTWKDAKKIKGGSELAKKYLLNEIPEFRENGCKTVATAGHFLTVHGHEGRGLNEAEVAGEVDKGGAQDGAAEAQTGVLLEHGVAIGLRSLTPER